MRTCAPGLAALILLLMLGSPASALERFYLKKNEEFCDTQQMLCLHGSITYEPNYRILNLRARVQKQTGPGEMRLYFSGSNRQGMLRRAEIVVNIRGTHSEIVDHRIRPDAPDVANWQLTDFQFTPDSR